MNTTKKKAIVFLCLLIIAIPLFAQLTRTDLQTMYVDFLSEEGYGPKVDGDGDVVFKAEGRTFYIEVNENDLQYFRVVFPNFWKIGSETEKAKVAIAAAYASSKTKVAKAFILGDNTTISAEVYLTDPYDFKIVFKRMFSSISTAINHFKTKISE
jgi:hypothetical protein